MSAGHKSGQMTPNDETRASSGLFPSCGAIHHTTGPSHGRPFRLIPLAHAPALALTRSIPPSRTFDTELVNPRFLISFPTLWASSSSTTLDDESWDEATGAEWAMVRRDAEALTAESGARGREVSRRSMMGVRKGGPAMEAKQISMRWSRERDRDRVFIYGIVTWSSREKQQQPPTGNDRMIGRDQNCHVMVWRFEPVITFTLARCGSLDAAAFESVNSRLTTGCTNININTDFTSLHLPPPPPCRRVRRTW